MPCPDHWQWCPGAGKLSPALNFGLDQGPGAMVEVYRTPLVADLVRSGHRDIRAVDIKPLSRWYQRSDVAENVVADLRELDAGGR